MDIISRKEAQELGMTHYFTGKICKNGHIDKREIRSCGCVECGRGRARNRERDTKYSIKWKSANPEWSMWISAKTRARNGGIPFTIVKEDIIIPTHCPVLGIEMQINIGGAQHSSPSLDRIHNDEGYIPGNINVISWLANRMKGRLTVDQMVMMGKFYEQYQK